MNEIMGEDKPKAHGKKETKKWWRGWLQKEDRDSYCVLYNYVNGFKNMITN